MQYQITVLTISTVIPSGTDASAPYAPWSGWEPIVLTDPQLSMITLDDDDGIFRSGYYSQGLTDQKLVEPVVFGHGAAAQTVPAGTQMSNFIASYITSSDGDLFVVLFPRNYESDNVGAEFGGRYSVLVIPQPDANGVEPVFDPTQSFTFSGIKKLLAADDGTLLPAPFAGVPCFAAGTMIATPTGPRAVQTLLAGDLLSTVDHGALPVLWVGHCQIGTRDLDLRPNQRPILIAAHALGPNRPARDLIVSPQHRMLITSRIAQRMTGQSDVLVAARHLVGMPGITVQLVDTITYWHVLLEGHQLLLAEGAVTESLLPGRMALMTLGPDNTRQIMAILDGRVTAPARHLMSGRQARSLTQRHIRNSRMLVDC